MKQAHGIGYLATIEHGEPRLHPLEFVLLDGEFWAPMSLAAQEFVTDCDGQHVEVLFMNDEFDSIRVHGILACSDAPEDIQRLTEFHPANPRETPVVRIIPDTLMYRSAHHASQYRRAA